MSTYCSNYLTLTAVLDSDTERFTVISDDHGVLAKNISIKLRMPNGELRPISELGEAEYCDVSPYIYLGGSKNAETKIPFRFRHKNDRVTFEIENLPDGITPVYEGEFCFGDGADLLSVCLDRDEELRDLRSSLGPAVSVCDNAIFNRRTDTAVSIDGTVYRRIGFSYDKNAYTFKAEGDLTFTLHERLIENRFHVKYGAINKNCTFKKPPAGWMTWYAVKFGASEKAVLENAAKQKEYFGDYGADAIWVDWEWYHSTLKGTPVSDDIGFMNPDPVRYPNGLKYVSDEIKKLGFTPCLWVGPTVEPDETVTAKKFSDAVYYVGPQWCGRYFFDITNERVRDELIPEAFEKVKEWGFEALKWDCLPSTLIIADRFNHLKKHPEMSSALALRGLIKKARETVGKDFYMLSCSGVPRTVELSTEDFDGCRIGGDIFTWDEYIKAFVEEILRYYPYHNTAYYCDPDNVVVRDEFNSLDQARARISMVCLLGLPTTFGDDLRELPMERVELIRRGLPTVDACPKDMRRGMHDGKRFLVNLAVSRPFEEWNVAGVLNLLTEESETTVDLKKDLCLDDGDYLVYDYWNNKFLGTFSDKITLLQPATSVSVLSFRRKLDRPQLLSTSRHITQGAVDLTDVRWNSSARTLTVNADVVKGDPYKISIYVPDGFVPENGTVRDNVLVISPDTSENGSIEITVKFN